MNRSNYFNFINEKLSSLATGIEMRGHLNFLDVHIHAETFYRDFFNLLFGWNLEKTANSLDGVKRNRGHAAPLLPSICYQPYL